MTQVSGKISKALVKDWTISPKNSATRGCCYLRLGGGKGTILAALCQEYPNIQGILMETPGTAQRAREYVRQVGLDERIQVVEGDFFQALPPVLATCDVFFSRPSFMIGGDEDCVKIIRNIRHVASRPHAKLAAHDIVMGVDGNAKHLEYEKILRNLSMMCFCEGERMSKEFFQLFSQARLPSLPKLIKFRDLTSVVEVDLTT